MHIAEVVTIAKSLPLLRLNTYKSLILSYSADYRRIFRKNNMLSMEELSGLDMSIPEESIDEEEQEERNKLLLEKLQKLPHQELQVVRAVIMENKKYKEAAEELHISVNTLKTHLTRALKQLRKEYNLHSLFY